MAAKRDPEQSLKRGGDELEERLERLEDHIDEAKHELAERREDADEPEGGVVTGDWQGQGRDAPAGEDPVGAGEDVESPAPERQEGGRESEGRRPDAGAAGA